MNKNEIFKLAKRFKERAKNCIRIARENVEKALHKSFFSPYSFRLGHRPSLILLVVFSKFLVLLHRRNKKRDMRSLWIQRINAGTRQHGVKKVLQEKSMPEPYIFKALVDISRNAFPGNKNVVHPPRKVDISSVNV
ncbi:hypothetical protein Peur_052967 [Populus x canadensis]